MEAGYDGPTIRRVAALDNPGGWETDQYLARFMQEADMKLLSRCDAAVRVAYDTAREILDQQLDPLAYVHFFFELNIKADYCRELAGLYSLEDEIYLAREYLGQTEDSARVFVRDTLTSFVREFETTPTLPAKLL